MKAAQAQLREAGIAFVSRSSGGHLLVSRGDGVVDFWPRRGRWRCRESGKNNIGVETLIDYCNTQEKPCPSRTTSTDETN